MVAVGPGIRDQSVGGDNLFPFPSDFAGAVFVHKEDGWVTEVRKVDSTGLDQTFVVAVDDGGGAWEIVASGSAVRGIRSNNVTFARLSAFVPAGTRFVVGQLDTAGPSRASVIPTHAFNPTPDLWPMCTTYVRSFVADSNATHVFNEQSTIAIMYGFVWRAASETTCPEYNGVACSGSPCDTSGPVPLCVCPSGARVESSLDCGPPVIGPVSKLDRQPLVEETSPFGRVEFRRNTVSITASLWPPGNIVGFRFSGRAINMPEMGEMLRMSLNEMATNGFSNHDDVFATRLNGTFAGQWCLGIFPDVPGRTLDTINIRLSAGLDVRLPYPSNMTTAELEFSFLYGNATCDSIFLNEDRYIPPGPPPVIPPRSPSTSSAGLIVVLVTLGTLLFVGGIVYLYRRGGRQARDHAKSDGAEKRRRKKRAKRVDHVSEKAMDTTCSDSSASTTRWTSESSADTVTYTQSTLV